jgi:hypothetical protein
MLYIIGQKQKGTSYRPRRWRLQCPSTHAQCRCDGEEWARGLRGSGNTRSGRGEFGPRRKKASSFSLLIFCFVFSLSNLDSNPFSSGSQDYHAAIKTTTCDVRFILFIVIYRCVYLM